MNRTKPGIFFMISVLLFLSTCKKKDINPIDQLPPETQEGKRTFGCLVNGKAFIPKGTFLGPPSLVSTYQALVEGNEFKGYSFRLAASRHEEGGAVRSIGLFTYDLEIHQGEKYSLDTAFIHGTAYGQYAVFDIYNTGINEYVTNGKIHTGELWIKKFDPVRQIVAGTFWFDAINQKGEKVEVREGRFDLYFTY